MKKSLIMAAALLFAGKAAAFPTAEEVAGYYTLTADFTLENPAYASLLSGEIEFELKVGYDNTINIIDFQSNMAIASEYDQSTGVMTLTGNTIRYGEKANSYKYLGLADKDANWKGMGKLNVTFGPWQVAEDGTISVPDFTVVDYSNYSTTKKVSVVARYSNCKVASRILSDEEIYGANFTGTYKFKGSCHEWIYEFDEESGTRVLAGERDTEDYDLEFVINEYNQIWLFDGYMVPDAGLLNTLRNRGYVNGNVFTLDCDTPNGINWNYIAEEDNYSTEVDLFGNAGNGEWWQGQTAFTLTKNADDTFTLTNIGLWRRAMEMQDGLDENGDPTGDKNQVRVIRKEKQWTNLRFVSYQEEVILPEIPDDDDPGTVEPGEDDPGTVDPGKDDPGNDNPGEDEPGQDNPGEDNPGEDDPGTVVPGGDDEEDAGVGSIDTDSAPVRYYNLQGQEIRNPRPGTIVIRVIGSRPEKLLL